MVGSWEWVKVSKVQGEDHADMSHNSLTSVLMSGIIHRAPSITDLISE